MGNPTVSGCTAVMETPVLPQEPEYRIVWRGVRAALLKNFLPVAFFVALTIGLAWPLPGQKVLIPVVRDVHVVTFINICTVFFISGLTLHTGELKQALTRRTVFGTVYGFIAILGITPVLGWATIRLPFTPLAFGTGLTIFCIMPTTLGVGVSLVTSAKGNVAQAIFLTVGTNVLGVVLIPLWLKAILPFAGEARVDGLDIGFADIFLKLFISSLVPTVIGKALRDFVPAVTRSVSRHKTLLSLVSNTSLAAIIWQTISSGRDAIVGAEVGTFLCVIVAACLIHLIYLVLNTLAVCALRVPLPEAVSLVIMASQKSAPVAVTTITYIARDTALQGVLAAPCVVGQLVQIFVGQPLAHYLAGRIARWRAAQAGGPHQADGTTLPCVNQSAAYTVEASKV